MASNEFRPRRNADAELEKLLEQEAELRRAYDDNISFLRLMAGCSICSTEEQQRIVGDIDDLRKKLVRLEARIWRFKYGK
jgi:hypothetical protein